MISKKNSLLALLIICINVTTADCRPQNHGKKNVGIVKNRKKSRGQATHLTNQWNATLEKITGTSAPFSVNLGEVGVAKYPNLNPITSPDKEFIGLIQLIINNNQKTFVGVFKGFSATRRAALLNTKAQAGPSNNSMGLIDFTTKFSRSKILPVLK